MELLKCIFYIAVIGIAANIIGNALPRRWFHPDRFPFKSFTWEKDGQIYRKIGIQVWKDRVPDMSKVSSAMYRKEVDSRPNAENISRLIQETCVAEATHNVLMLLSLYVVRICSGVWGWFVWLMCVLGNLPFSLIQRYNRPRLQKTLARMNGKNTQA